MSNDQADDHSGRVRQGRQAEDDHRVPPRTPQRPGETVAADLRRRILVREWAVDEALPTTAALVEHYHFSQAIVMRVLRVLAREGLVRTVPRWGTFRT
jgi:DNA-binding GntR family transcriptional regulator